MRKILIMLSFFIFSGMQAIAQKTISGKITDEYGEPLSGVNVEVKGFADFRTFTDLNGSYSLAVPKEGTTLIISFIGMKTREIQITSDVVNATMYIGDIIIDDVVVTALGITREKKSVGYSVQDIKEKELSKTRETNFINSLTGKIAGVNISNTSGAVGASSRIIIRGINSLSGNNQPLFVVDGIPISNNSFFDGVSDSDRGTGAADINPNDIQSISVLKGPNAAALYGSRASNGVILITTKTGNQKKGFGVEVSNYTTFEKPLKLPDYQNEYGQGTGGKFSFYDGKGGGINDGVDESWGPKLDIGLMIPQFNSPINPDGSRQPTPWISHPNNIRSFFETGITTTNSLSVTGGSEKSSFRASYSQTNQKGMVPNTDQTKKTVSINTSTKPTEKMEVSVAATYANTHSDNLPGWAMGSPMFRFSWFGRQVDMEALKDYRNRELGWTNEYGTVFNWMYNYGVNPYFNQYENLFPIDRNRLFGNLKMTYRIFDWLHLMLRTGGDYYSNINSGSWARRPKYPDNVQGSFQQTMSNFREINSDFLISIDKKFSDNFRLGINFGGNRMDQHYAQQYGAANELAIGGIYTINNSKVPIDASNTYLQKRINSLYFNGSLAYKDAVFLDFTGRNDWSSTLPEGSNSYFYPSVSLSALLSKLLRIESPALNYAKIRSSWSKVGSDTDPYNLQTTIGFGNGWNDATKLPELYVPNTLQNSLLKPQFITSTEFGIEIMSFKNRLGIDITYYFSDASGQILTLPISGTNGFTDKIVNAGTLKNNGIELSLTGTPVKIGDFQWNIILNWSKNNSKFTDLPEGVENYEIADWGIKFLAEKDQPYGSLYGDDYKRDDKGNIIHVNGLPQDGDWKTLGNYQPDWLGGINNELIYKNFSLSFLIDMKKGGDLFSVINVEGLYTGVLKETLNGREDGIIGKGVMEDPDNPGNYIPNIVKVSTEEYYKALTIPIISGIFDATFVKLREISIGYNIKKIRRFPIRDINISFIGRNLAILYSKVPHVDPEATLMSDSNIQGLEFDQIPSTRSFGFSINFKF